MPVPVREFKARLSHYLAQVRAGGTVEISSHRKVIARLTGAPEGHPPGIQRLLAAGAADYGGGKPRGSAVGLSRDAKSISEIVLEDRD